MPPVNDDMLARQAALFGADFEDLLTAGRAGSFHCRFPILQGRRGWVRDDPFRATFKAISFHAVTSL